MRGVPAEQADEDEERDVAVGAESEGTSYRTVSRRSALVPRTRRMNAGGSGVSEE